MNTQQIGSIGRQLVAALGIGSAVSNVHVSGHGQPLMLRAIALGGGVLLFVVEHYVSDPSTGSAPADPGNALPYVDPSSHSTTTSDLEAAYQQGRLRGQKEGVETVRAQPQAFDLAAQQHVDDMAHETRVQSLPANDRPKRNPAPPAPGPRG